MAQKKEKFYWITVLGKREELEKVEPKLGDLNLMCDYKNLISREYKKGIDLFSLRKLVVNEHPKVKIIVDTYVVEYVNENDKVVGSSKPTYMPVSTTCIDRMGSTETLIDYDNGVLGICFSKYTASTSYPYPFHIMYLVHEHLAYKFNKLYDRLENTSDNKERKEIEEMQKDIENKIDLIDQYVCNNLGINYNCLSMGRSPIIYIFEKDKEFKRFKG